MYHTGWSYRSTHRQPFNLKQILLATISIVTRMPILDTMIHAFYTFADMVATQMLVFALQWYGPIPLEYFEVAEMVLVACVAFLEGAAFMVVSPVRLTFEHMHVQYII